jgi:hypothetical protein
MTKNLTVFDSRHCAGSSQTHRHPASAGSGLPGSPERCRFPIMPEVNRRMSVYILDEAGPTLLQLISVLLQYNNLITTLAAQIQQHVDQFDPPKHHEHLSGHLKLIGLNIADAEKLIVPIHDEATIEARSRAPSTPFWRFWPPGKG